MISTENESFRSETLNAHLETPAEHVSRKKNITLSPQRSRNRTAWVNGNFK